MNATVSAIITLLAIFGASTVPAFSRENKHRPLRRKINAYLGAVAIWAFIIIVVGGVFWHVTTSEVSRQAAWNVIQPAIIILIPSLVIAIAMKRIDRSPTLCDIDRRSRR